MTSTASGIAVSAAISGAESSAAASTSTSPMLSLARRSEPARDLLTAAGRADSLDDARRGLGRDIQQHPAAGGGEQVQAAQQLLGALGAETFQVVQLPDGDRVAELLGGADLQLVIQLQRPARPEGGNPGELADTVGDIRAQFLQLGEGTGGADLADLRRDGLAYARDAEQGRTGQPGDVLRLGGERAGGFAVDAGTKRVAAGHDVQVRVFLDQRGYFVVGLGHSAIVAQRPGPGSPARAARPRRRGPTAMTR